jgi:hypothetical protein
MIDLTTPTSPVPSSPLPPLLLATLFHTERPDPESAAPGAQRWYQERRELEDYMGVEPSDWTVHFPVMVRLAIRKETVGGRPRAEQELQDLRTAVEDTHTHPEKTVTALETSHRPRIEALTKSHQKDMTDPYRQLKQDSQAEMLELNVLFGQLRAQAPRSSSKPSPFTPLKAPPRHKQPARPVGILKRPPTPGPQEPDLLISFSPSPTKMEIKGTGTLADCKWATGKVHPERIPQVLVVSPVHSPKRQETNIEREGTPEAPKRQEPEVE